MSNLSPYKAFPRCYSKTNSKYHLPKLLARLESCLSKSMYVNAIKTALAGGYAGRSWYKTLKRCHKRYARHQFKQYIIPNELL